MIRYCLRYFKPTKTTKGLMSQEDYLNLLRAPENYFDKAKLDNMLGTLKDFSKTIDLSQRKSHKLLESKGFIETLQNISAALHLFSMKQTVNFASILSYLNISQEETWSKLEKHLIRKVLKEVGPSEMAEITRACNECGRKSESLWNFLEVHILTKIYPNSNFDAAQLVQVFSDFKSANQGSVLLNKMLFKNLVEVAGTCKGRDLIRLTYFLSREKFVSEEVVTLVSKRAAEVANEVDSKGLMHLLSFLIKNHADFKHLEAIEQEVINKIKMFELNQLSFIMHTYAKSPNTQVMKSGVREKMMHSIEEYLFIDKKKLVERYRQDDIDNVIVKLMWGLSKFGCVTQKKLWKDYSKELYENKKLMSPQNEIFAKDLKSFVKINGFS